MKRMNVNMTWRKIDDKTYQSSDDIFIIKKYGNSSNKIYDLEIAKLKEPLRLSRYEYFKSLKEAKKYASFISTLFDFDVDTVEEFRFKNNSKEMSAGEKFLIYNNKYINENKLGVKDFRLDKALSKKPSLKQYL